MKIDMNWKNLQKKLKMGVALADKRRRASDVTKFNNPIERKAFDAARASGELGDADFVGQLQSGDLIPDRLFGWSTKTILAISLVALLVKLKAMRATR